MIINESYYKRLGISFSSEDKVKEYAKMNNIKDYRITAIADPLNKGQRIFNIEVKED